ncbi:MAG: RAD55 family ATPase [Candidatus Woesearchaeota archaeon]
MPMKEDALTKFIFQKKSQGYSNQYIQNYLDVFISKNKFDSQSYIHTTHILLYIIEAKKRRKTTYEIKQSLRKVGWLEEDISRAFSIIEQIQKNHAISNFSELQTKVSEQMHNTALLLDSLHKKESEDVQKQIHEKFSGKSHFYTELLQHSQVSDSDQNTKSGDTKAHNIDSQTESSAKSGKKKSVKDDTQKMNQSVKKSEQSEEEKQQEQEVKKTKEVVKLSSQYKNPVHIHADSLTVGSQNKRKVKNINDLDSLEQEYMSQGQLSGSQYGFYNKVEQEELQLAQEPIGDRAQTGIPDLDQVIDGGFLRLSQTLISGGPGTGKSTFGLQYLINGIVLFNEPGVYVTFEQSREAIIELGKQFGWDIENLEKQEMLIIHEYTPEQVYKALKSGGGSFRDLVESIQAKRIVLDSITEYALLFNTEMSQRREIADFYRNLSRWGCTGLVIGEEESTITTRDASALDYESDAVILLYNERKGDIRQRSLEIYKMRGTKHAGRIFPMKVTDNGILVNIKAEQILRK